MPCGSIARSLCARIHTYGSSRRRSATRDTAMLTLAPEQLRRRRRRADYEAIAASVVLIAFGLELI